MNKENKNEEKLTKEEEDNRKQNQEEDVNVTEDIKDTINTVKEEVKEAVDETVNPKSTEEIMMGIMSEVRRAESIVGGKKEVKVNKRHKKLPRGYSATPLYGEIDLSAYKDDELTVELESSAVTITILEGVRSSGLKIVKRRILRAAPVVLSIVALMFLFQKIIFNPDPANDYVKLITILMAGGQFLTVFSLLQIKSADDRLELEANFIKGAVEEHKPASLIIKLNEAYEKSLIESDNAHTMLSRQLDYCLLLWVAFILIAVL